MEFLLLVETEIYGIARSPFLSRVVLHLLYECTLPDKRLKLAAPGVYSRIPFVIISVRRRSFL
jgi:hypothetical protein